jgi:hypothetical protein
MSHDAHDHGIRRREQGYTPTMIIEESRMLQVSIFETLHEHVDQVDPGLLLLDMMVIADEVDSQLAQEMAGYIVEAETDAKTIEYMNHLGSPMIISEEELIKQMYLAKNIAKKRSFAVFQRMSTARSLSRRRWLD